MINRILLTTLAIFFVACGGGGGGGDGGSSSGVKVMHAGLDAAPVDLISSLSPNVLQTVRFMEVSRYAGITSGQQILNLNRTKGGPLVANEPLNYQSGEKYSLLLTGSLSGSGLILNLLSDGGSEIASGNSAVRIVNGVEYSSNLRLQIAGQESTVAPYASASSYLQLPAGAYDFKVLSSSGSSATSGTVELVAGKSYSVLAGGKAGYFVANRVYED